MSSASSGSSASSTPPLRATIGFWIWLVAAVLLMVGGMIAATSDLPGVNTTLFRGAGVLTALAGAAMAFLAGRGRSGDPRYRRAAIGLSLALVVVVALTVVIGVVHILTVLGVILLIVGTILNSRVDFGRRDD